mmetsp:Transcript_5775/g.7371  ORF Transcript_5775/g.7371 Transcript_5775/m.7371 type:complete len:356 (-) Transcript_5775:314-1381(-)
MNIFLLKPLLFIINKKGRNMVTALDAVGKTGEFKRSESKFRNFIQVGSETYPPEEGRYHVHIALACPWANGVLTLIYMKGLEDAISHSIVHPTWGKTKLDDDHTGWRYKRPGDDPVSSIHGHGSFKCDDALIPDNITNCGTIRELYEKCGQDNGPYTTPVIYDKKTKTIVNNESTDILRMINDEFQHLAKNPDVDLYPKDLVDSLQELNDKVIYPKVNNGVYRCGFAKTQEAYDHAVQELFDSLDELETKLSKSRYLVGNRFTWLDLRLYMTLVRFDPVYITYFKTNKKRIVDYQNLLGYVRDIYSIEAVKKTTNMDHIKTHYFTSHPTLNAFAIIPSYNGPDLDLPSGRESLSN